MVKKYDKAELIELRKLGLSIREISKRVDVPVSTVHWVVRDIEPRYCNIFGYDGDRGELYLHLPYKLICPKCGKAQNHWIMCADDGDWMPAECDCSGHSGHAYSWTDLKRQFPIVQDDVIVATVIQDEMSIATVIQGQ